MEKETNPAKQMQVSRFLVTCTDDEGNFVFHPCRTFESLAAAEKYAAGISSSREVRILLVCVSRPGVHCS